MEGTELVRRTWCYIRAPYSFEMSGCPCGETEVTWSEFVGHLWCPVCERDFVPSDIGVFDGPIPIQTAHLMGMCFATININEASPDFKKITPCDTKLCPYREAV